MVKYFSLLLVLAATGCSKPSKPAEQTHVSNPITNYVGGLQGDVRQAQSAAHKMNTGIQTSQDSVKEMQSQSE